MDMKNMKCTIEAMVLSGQLKITADTDKEMFDRIKGIALSFETQMQYASAIHYVGVTEEFRKVIKLFHVPAGITPAGFRHELVYGSDGSLRVLKTANLPDTRLIVCNTKSAQMYYDIDKLVVEPEFADMKQSVILTCEPEYFAQFTTSPTIYCYQRSFLSAVQ